MKEFTKSAGTRSILPGQQIFFLLPGYHAQGHDLNVFSEIFCKHFHPKRVVSFKERAERDEREARGHFHENPVHWLTPGVGPTSIPCSISENGPFENFQRSNSIFI